MKLTKKVSGEDRSSIPIHEAQDVRLDIFIVDNRHTLFEACCINEAI
jgi:hypothetical protein